MTQQSQKLTWGDGICAGAYDPQWGVRTYPRDGVETGRHVDVLDPKWNHGQRPLWVSRSGLSGAALDAVVHPMTIELGTIRTDTARWEAHHKGHLAGWDLYLTHRHLDPQGQVLAVRGLKGKSYAAECEMTLVQVSELASFLSGDREPKWDGRPLEQVAYVFYRPGESDVKVKVVAQRVGTVGWVKWTRSEWLRALRAVYADYLSVGKIRGWPSDRIRRWPSLPIVGLASNGYTTVYRLSGGMLVEMLYPEKGEDWEPSEDWAYNDGLFGHVLFSAPGRYLYADDSGTLTWHPCGCQASDAEQAELLRHPDVAPAHDCDWERRERERREREFNLALREENARLASAEPAAEWEAELLAASGHADMI